MDFGFQRILKENPCPDISAHDIGMPLCPGYFVGLGSTYQVVGVMGRAEVSIHM